MALFKLPTQICFLEYPDCIKVDFRKSWQQKCQIRSRSQFGMVRIGVTSLATQSRYQSLFCVTWFPTHHTHGPWSDTPKSKSRLPFSACRLLVHRLLLCHLMMEEFKNSDAQIVEGSRILTEMICKWRASYLKPASCESDWKHTNDS